MAELLAIDGGAPVFPEGPPSWPRPDERVRAALDAAYADGSWGKYHGGKVEQLEAAISRTHGVNHALACASGTFAVELALRALKIGERDEVALAGYDFPGNFRAIEAVGARPALVDIEPQTWCMDAAQLRDALAPETKALIVSHLHGGIADMQAIVELCRSRGVAVVEDACQSPAAMVQGRIAGTWGDVGVWSFGGSKLLTAGRGGAIFTNDPQIAQRAKIFCERGNHAFPLSELQAAVLLPQVDTLAAHNTHRRASALRLLHQLADEPGLSGLTMPSPRGEASFYKLAWLLSQGNREAFIRAIQAEGVAIDAGFRGFRGRTVARCRRVGDLSHSARAGEQTIILHHPILLGTPAIDRVALAITKVLRSFH